MSPSPSRWVDLAPDSFTERLLAGGRRRAWLRDDGDRLRASCPHLEEVADFVESESDAERRHEAVFFEVGRESGALFSAFLHRTRRGQAQGGVRHADYPSVAALLHDGLRLSQGMSRKSALAGLWWGGGKGIIARRADKAWREAGARRQLYAEYGAFVASLCGAYVTAEDAGTSPLDMASVFRHTRFATCIPQEAGGTGNPSWMTAAGVVCAIEAALDLRGSRRLPGARVAMQGGGNVGMRMIEFLLERGAAEVLVAEICPERCAALQDAFGDGRVRVARVEPGDASIFAARCDVLVPNALGGVLGPKTIPHVRAAIVCGAANNPLEDDERDAAALAERGISYVPDFVANRMGIVSCANEQYGSPPRDPELVRHLGREWQGSVYHVTRQVLERAREAGITPLASARHWADERSDELHPIFGHRARRIVDSVVESGWERG